VIPIVVIEEIDHSKRVWMKKVETQGKLADIWILSGNRAAFRKV
jgi:hypothetical protein